MAPTGMGIAPSGAPTTARRATTGDGACVDTVLIRAFDDLPSCNFKAGVIDYQCAAYKKVHQLIVKREAEDRALVQLSLLRLLRHTDERVRLVAAKGLSTYAVQHSVTRRLVAAFGTERSPHVRAWIVHSLHGPLPAAAQLVLRALTRDPSAVVRARAALRLGTARYAKSPAVAKALARSISADKSVDVRKRAAESLGAVKQDRATEQLLVGCLSDPRVGPHCAIGLGRMRSKAGYLAVLARLRAGLKKGRLHPLFVWTIMDFARQPFFAAQAVRLLLQRIAASRKMVPGARHYAVKSLGQLAVQVASQKTAVLQFLKNLAPDKALAVPLKATLARLKGPVRRPGPGAPGPKK